MLPKQHFVIPFVCSQNLYIPAVLQGHIADTYCSAACIEVHLKIRQILTFTQHKMCMMPSTYTEEGKNALVTCVLHKEFMLL